jgi:hypothetical protein
MLVRVGGPYCVSRQVAVNRRMAVRPRIIRPGAQAAPASDTEPAVAEETVSTGLDSAEPDFDESVYLRAFPDIAEAVRRGVLPSGLAHYRQSGRAEGRLEKPEYRALLGIGAQSAAPQVSIDTLTISPSGCTLMTGWSDDRLDPLGGITMQVRPEVRHNWETFPRLARSDVARTLDPAANHKFGFMLVAAPTGGPAASTIDPRTAGQPVFRFASGVESRPRRDPVVASDEDLRDLALAALPSAAQEGDTAALFAILDQHVGVQIAAINRLIIEQARGRRLAEHFGPRRERYRGSVIMSLRGPATEIVPWLALTANGAEADSYEYIVVVTDPDQFESAARAAHMAELTLGVPLTVVFHVGGDPSGTGEDAAADQARSDRLVFMDQSVFPRLPDWAARLAALLDEAPSAQTRLMGGMLYHADGTLCHGGYYFEQELSVFAAQSEPPRRTIAPRLKAIASPLPSPTARPVAGVPAAFLSVDRAWFETLGGFARHYSRAAYEDIDLCLRGLRRGVPAWVHPLPFWYLERRGPPRPEPSKGGTILNNWLLHRQWDEMIVPNLLGQTPSLLASQA